MLVNYICHLRGRLLSYSPTLLPSLLNNLQPILGITLQYQTSVISRPWFHIIYIRLSFIFPSLHLTYTPLRHTLNFFLFSYLLYSTASNPYRFINLISNLLHQHPLVLYNPHSSALHLPFARTSYANLLTPVRLHAFLTWVSRSTGFISTFIRDYTIVRCFLWYNIKLQPWIKLKAQLKAQTLR